MEIFRSTRRDFSPDFHPRAHNLLQLIDFMALPTGFEPVLQP